MSDRCPICQQVSPADSGVTCSGCEGCYHPACIKLLPDDTEFIKEHGKAWKCPECLQAGRRLRSQSTSSKSALVSSTASSLSLSKDQIGLLFSELASIKSTQQSIVVDLARIKDSQSSLTVEIRSKCEQLQNSITHLGSQLKDHADTISQHTSDISDLNERLSRMESQLDRVANREAGAGFGISGCSQDNVLDGLAAEFEERTKRSRNIMIFNVEEPQATDAPGRKQADEAYVSGLFGFLDTTPSISKVVRVGKKPGDGRRRPIRVTLRSVDDVHGLIKSARKLSGEDRYKHVSLSFDRTPLQLAKYRELKKQLQARVSNGERGLGIRYVSGSPRIVALNR